MTSILEFLKTQLKITVFTGKLFNIEQRSDAVVTGYAFIFEEVNKVTQKAFYSRYFVLQKINSP
jgi:hypothetical protein